MKANAQCSGCLRTYEKKEFKKKTIQGEPVYSCPACGYYHTPSIFPKARQSLKKGYYSFKGYLYKWDGKTLERLKNGYKPEKKLIRPILEASFYLGKNYTDPKLITIKDNLHDNLDS